MVPASFETFFLATAGAGGALIGLLFVAISIHPQRTFGKPAARGISDQQLAEATLLTLLNGFVISSCALIPDINVGWIALLLGFGGASIASPVSWRVARLHHHGSTHWRCWRHQLHVTVLGLLSTLLYVVQCALALRMLLVPGDGTPVTWLALVLVGLYLVGIVRAWTLLGNPQRGWSGWLNPLQDLPRGPEEILTGDDAS